MIKTNPIKSKQYKMIPVNKKSKPNDNMLIGIAILVGVISIPISYVFGNPLTHVNIFLITLFFNVFTYGVVINMLAKKFLLKATSSAMMMGGAYFGYVEVSKRNWSAINYLTVTGMVFDLFMVAILIEKLKIPK